MGAVSAQVLQGHGVRVLRVLWVMRGWGVRVLRVQRVLGVLWMLGGVGCGC